MTTLKRLASSIILEFHVFIEKQIGSMLDKNQQNNNVKMYSNSKLNTR